jgi:hypothetical protein
VVSASFNTFRRLKVGVLRSKSHLLDHVNGYDGDRNYVLEAGVYPSFSAVPDHGHVLRSRVTDLRLFSDISDISDLLRTFAFQTPVSSDRLCSLRVA